MGCYVKCCFWCSGCIAICCPCHPDHGGASLQDIRECCTIVNKCSDFLTHKPNYVYLIDEQELLSK